MKNHSPSSQVEKSKKKNGSAEWAPRSEPLADPQNRVLGVTTVSDNGPQIQLQHRPKHLDQS